MWFVEAAQAQETVALRFAWAPGMSATGTSTHLHRIERTGGHVEESTWENARTVDVRDGGDALVIGGTSRRTAEARTVNGVATPPDPIVAAFLDALEGVPEDYRVGRDGAFLGLVSEGLFRQQVDAAVSDLFASLLAKAPDDATRARAEAVMAPLRQAASPEVVVAQMADEWAYQVAFWVGGELRLGDRYEVRWDGASGVTGAPLGHHATFSANEVRPCRKGRKAPTCVALELVVAIDEDDLRAMVLPVMEKVATAYASTDPVVVDVSTNVTTWTGLVERDTLRPWAWDRTRVTRLDGRVGAEAHSQVTTESSTYRWDWGR